MDAILINVPFKCCYQLRFFFPREEEFPAARGDYPYCFEMFTSQFLKRKREFIELVDEQLGSVCSDNEPCEAHKIKEFLNEYFEYLKNNLLNEGKFPTKLLFKKSKLNVAICGWYPQWV